MPDLSTVRYIEVPDGQRYPVTPEWKGDTLRLVPDEGSLPFTLENEGDARLLDADGQHLMTFSLRYLGPSAAGAPLGLDLSGD